MTGKIIAVGNLKGGTGKTTIAVNLGAELAGDGRQPVTLVDADTQESASTWLAQNGQAGMTCEALPLNGNGSAAHWLTEVRRLAKDNDYVLVDLPPNAGSAMQAALAGADLVVVPVTPSPLDFHAAAQVLRLLRGAREARRGSRPSCLLVGSKVDRRTAVGRAFEMALKEFKEPVGPSLCQRTAFVNAAILGDWVGQTARSSPAYEEVSALAKRVKRVLKN